ncbi:MAG TPA: DNA repair protein RecN [Ignavibacteriaceae bacterium]|nr:DNA repair protein RecN [Ignavibacteriaceae bacterium]
MLKSFEVKDYALIEHISVEFGSGLNIITGETGAGKSILIDAMSLLLGERASTEVVRKGAEKSFVEGFFNVKGNKKVKSLLEENDIDFTDELIIRREISLKGSNRCFINDTPVNLNLVKDIGNLLVDLHGQHEHQSLLRTETHIDYLDEFGDYQDILQQYKKLYSDLLQKEIELRELQSKESSIKEKKDFYSFQIKEIDTISPQEDEEDKLIEELKILENSEKLAELTSEVYQLIYESDNSIQISLSKVRTLLQKLSDIDKSFSDALSESESALANIEDVSNFVRSYNSKINLDQNEVEGKRERLGAINLLKKKYGGSVKSIIDYRKKIGEEFELAENFSGKINELSKNIFELRKYAGSLAKNLSKKREQAAKLVKKGIEETLKELGIQEPQFKTQIINEETEKDSGVFLDGKYFRATSKGIDEVEFFISTNPGEDLKPLSKVASGGEVSRIMLSLKSTLAENDKLPLLIFDEIDVGVSGRIAQKVGKALKNLSEYHQVISITHLPQIASYADHHFSIEKVTQNERVVSSIKKLPESERITEIARLLSGEKITPASLKSARELIGLRE